MPTSPDTTPDPLQDVLRLGQKCLKAAPVVVLGSGASMALGIRGMGPLADYLIEKVTTIDGEQTLWKSFKECLTRNRDLERALQEITLNERLLAEVIRFTREMVLTDDLALFEKIVQGDTGLALSRLFTHLFRSTHETVSVVTTNYDRVAEYAANVSHHHFNDGFTDGHLRHFRSPSPFRETPGKRSKSVNVWKVHGSVDWFVGPNKVPLALPHRESYPPCCKPLLVTPGVTKYEMTHQEPFRTIIAQADIALSSARGFLCVGYGFADTHIEPKLLQRAIDYKPPIVILARTLRDGARTFLKRCTHEKVLALEKEGEGTRAYSKKLPEGITLPGASLWDLDAFLIALGITS